MSWIKQIKGIVQRRRLAKELGGKASIAKHHERGKLTIRERINLLLDKDTFQEQGKIAGGAHLNDAGDIIKFIPSNYILGFGSINKRSVVVGGEDFTLKGGSPNAAGLRKSVYAEHLALEYKIPLVRLLEGGGGNIGSGDIDPKKPQTVGEPLHSEPRFKVISDSLGQIPVVSAALGPVAGFPAGRLVASHFSVMVKGTSQIMTGGPALVKRALGRSLTKEELGGYQIHAQSGVVDNVANNEREALEQIRKFLSYFPQNVWEPAPRVKCQNDIADRTESSLTNIVPEDKRQTFNMLDIIELIVDKNSFFRTSPLYGPELITGYARLDGQSVGITANDCRYNAGAMTADAAQKMRRMIETCETFHLPLVNFVDEPGFMIGPNAESAATIRYGMAAVAAASTAKMPWASIRVRKSYGVASAAHYNGSNYILDWPSSENGPLPLEGGVAVAFHREIEAAKNPESKRDELEKKFAATKSPFRAAESFAVHDIIDPKETRPLLCQWVDNIQTKLKNMVGEEFFSVRP